MNAIMSITVPDVKSNYSSLKKFLTAEDPLGATELYFKILFSIQEEGSIKNVYSEILDFLKMAEKKKGKIGKIEKVEYEYELGDEYEYIRIEIIYPIN